MSHVSYTGFVPDFKAARRENLEYQNVYGQNKSPHDPGFEIGGDKAAIARQSYTTPSIRATLANPMTFAKQGAIQGITSRYGLSPQNILKMEGIDFWKYRKNLNLQKQLTLTEKNAIPDMIAQGTENSSAMGKTVGLVLIISLAFLAISTTVQ